MIRNTFCADIITKRGKGHVAGGERYAINKRRSGVGRLVTCPEHEAWGPCFVIFLILF